jgi:hypothetical protein
MGNGEWVLVPVMLTAMQVHAYMLRGRSRKCAHQDGRIEPFRWAQDPDGVHLQAGSHQSFSKLRKLPQTHNRYSKTFINPSSRCEIDMSRLHFESLGHDCQ